MKDSLDCKAVARLLSDGQDEKLSTGARARLRLHRVVCKTCRNVERQMALLRAAMRRLGERPPEH